jgi:ribonuclease HI
MANEQAPPGVKAILVCDGSARPNPGFGGYGIFGYLFKDAPRPKNTKHPVKDKLSFTDQGVSDKKSETPIEVTHILEVACAVNDPGCTNNDSELKAALHALEYVHSHPEIVSAKIMTDSEYIVKSFADSLDKWLANGFKRMDGRQIVHVEDWVAIDVYRKAIRERGTQLCFEWVKGHSGD